MDHPMISSEADASNEKNIVVSLLRRDNYWDCNFTFKKKNVSYEDLFAKSLPTHNKHNHAHVCQ